MIDANGATNRFEYDVAGRKTRQIDALGRTNFFFYDLSDNLTNTINALGFANAYTYDVNNNRTSSTDARGAVTANSFDTKDRLVAVVDALGGTITNNYDPLDRKVQTVDARLNPINYAYDAVGNLVAVTNALGEVTQYTYDANGNQTSVIDPTERVTTNFFDALNRRVFTVDALLHTNASGYDALSRLSATTNADGQVTRFFYDAIGRLTNVMDAAGQSVFFAYDENGNRIRTTGPNGHTWTNVFDRVNRLVEQDDPLGHRTLLYYDPVGNLTNKITPNGDNILYAYDGLNRLTNITYPTGPPVSFAYDPNGNRTNMLDGLGDTVWKYDPLNRLTGVTDPFGQTVQNAFDPNANRVTLTYPGGNTVRYGFDALNRMRALTNWLGGVVTYSYDHRGNLTGSTNANGTTAAYGYDDASRLVTLTNLAPDVAVIAAYALTLDPIANHTASAQTQPLVPILSNQTNSYTYDSDNRLITLDGQTVTHNPNGDLTGIGTNTTYTYDFNDRLVRFTVTNISGACAYDGLGSRLSRTLNGQTARFVLDRLGTLTQVLAETDTNGSPSAYYIYGIGLAERIMPDASVATYHYDIQGSTVALSDSNGNVTDSYAYDSFGGLANNDGDSPQSFRYLGRYGIVDDGNGLYHARARYFNPQLGRFLTKDPVTGKDSDSQRLNRYVYALNNPLKILDVSGLRPQEGYFLYEPGANANSTPSVAFHYDPYWQAFWQEFGASLVENTGNALFYVAIAAELIDAATPLIQIAAPAIGAGGYGLRSLGSELSDSIRNDSKASLTKNGPALAQELGTAGEQMSGIVGPKTRIPSLTGTANYRVPDELIPDVSLRDAKNVGELRVTPQLIDFGQYSQQRNLRFILDIRQNTIIGPNAQQFIGQYGVQINRIYPAR
ncbi:hypothetical protein KGQ27_00045 [Patescibacteria group bacterium]|nr:hypothetical protein [Patescibacteria group bacterium]MDE1946607.1 hypothetical protein [Patescibacteria group bacterium]